MLFFTALINMTSLGCQRPPSPQQWGEESKPIRTKCVNSPCGSWVQNVFFSFCKKEEEEVEEEEEEKDKDKMTFRKRNKSMFSFEITSKKKKKGKQVCVH